MNRGYKIGSPLQEKSFIFCTILSSFYFTYHVLSRMKNHFSLPRKILMETKLKSKENQSLAQGSKKKTILDMKMVN